MSPSLYFLCNRVYLVISVVFHIIQVQSFLPHCVSWPVLQRENRSMIKVAPQGNHLWHCMCKCYVLNAFFTFAFTPSPLKHITCNNLWSNSVLLSSLLKFWVLLLNHECPNKCVFYCFYAFICVFLHFLWWNLPKFLTAHCFQWDMNFKHKASFSISSKLCLSLLKKKPGVIAFPEKRAPTKVKYLQPICQILQNFTTGNARKFSVSFAFCAHVDTMKYPKTLKFSFRSAHITNEFSSSVHVRFQNYRSYLKLTPK